jgi:hypothetical protein
VNRFYVIVRREEGSLRFAKQSSLTFIRDIKFRHTASYSEMSANYQFIEDNGSMRMREKSIKEESKSA